MSLITSGVSLHHGNKKENHPWSKKRHFVAAHWSGNGHKTISKHFDIHSAVRLFANGNPSRTLQIVLQPYDLEKFEWLIQWTILYTGRILRQMWGNLSSRLSWPEFGSCNRTMMSGIHFHSSLSLRLQVQCLITFGKNDNVINMCLLEMDMILNERKKKQ